MIARVSNWGRWGPDDELGTVNYITESKRVESSRLVESGETISLALPFDRAGPQPPHERRLNVQHIMLETGTDLRAGVQRNSVGGWGYADDMVVMALQCGTQWDSLAHAFYDFKMYNDRDCTLVTADGAAKNSIVVLADRIVSRGVLVDLPRAAGLPWLPTEHHITSGELDTALVREGVQTAPGDVLLIRTGHLARARASGGWAGYTYAGEPGIGLEELPWIHEKRLAAVATDTWAFELLPSDYSIMLPVHAVGIVHMGLLLGEMFDFESLAAACARDARFEFLFVAPPLPFTGAVGSPVNPLAIR